MSRLTANNTKVSYKAAGADKFTELEYLMEVPEIGGDYEKIDVTVLSDSVKRYVPGMKEIGDLVLKFLYDNSSATSNFRVLKGLETAQEAATFKIAYPDGTSHQFEAIPAVKMDAATVNGAMTFSAAMTLLGDIEVVDPA